ncbi:MAG: hypothetical protein ACI88A_000999 [Paraglaciecola sp.]|jgi:hypothetical protein
MDSTIGAVIAYIQTAKAKFITKYAYTLLSNANMESTHLVLLLLSCDTGLGFKYKGHVLYE